MTGHRARQTWRAARLSIGAERGAAALLTLLLACTGLAAGAAVLVLTLDLAATAARARTAADAAALAAAATSPLVRGFADVAAGARPGEARSAAARVASANGAQLDDIDLTGWPLRVAVRVSVEPRTSLVQRFTSDAQAGATAGVRPSAGDHPP